MSYANAVLHANSILREIRMSFPEPQNHSAYDEDLVAIFVSTLELVKVLKSEKPILGTRNDLDYVVAKRSELPEKMSSLENVVPELVSYLEGLPIWGHSRMQQNVIPPASIPSIIGALLAILYNPNLAWDKYSHKVAEAEVETVAIVSKLIGYDPTKSSGVSTFGGTGTVLYAMKVGLEKAIPGAMKQGIRREDQPVIFASDCSHYCHDNVAGWLGLGTDSIIKIPTNIHNEMDIKVLREEAHKALSEGKKIVGIICTMGTTDAFGVDNLEEVVSLRNELADEFQLKPKPHIHADAVIGWIWSVFNQYPWEENPLNFNRGTIHSLAPTQQRMCHLGLADSVGIDFHKTGFTPCVSSFVLFKEQEDLKLLTRKKEDINYLFDSGEYHPGLFTLETSRSGAAVLAALANLKLFGKEGFQRIIGHLVEMTQLLRGELGGHPCTTVLNDDNFGTVTLFRVYPEERVYHDTIMELEFTNPAYREQLLKHNEFNRKIYEYLDKEAMEGKGVSISWTSCYRHTAYGNGEPEEKVPALKSYILSPFTNQECIKQLVDKVLEARKQIALQ